MKYILVKYKLGNMLYVFENCEKLKVEQLGALIFNFF